VFAELLAQPGVVERAELRSRFGFVAVHGGSLERATAEIAREAAEASGASVYTVEQPEDLRWHLPSHCSDPACSVALRSFLDHAAAVVSIHGYGREGCWTRLLLGGANRDLARALGDRLRVALPAYEIDDDIERVPRELRGLDPRNPVNLPRQGGVQVELPPRVRGLGPNADHAARGALVEALAAFAVERA
jgi:phage replication-related protein YjqB (UPF0714/DUF867 family)